MNWKKLLYYVPGVGLATHAIKEYKTRKGQRPWYDIREAKDRKALGMYAVETGLLVFAISWKVWLGNGIATKEWNPINQFKNYTEKRVERKERRLEKKNELEKNVYYDELVK
jgi:hypothetical protein